MIFISNVLATSCGPRRGEAGGFSPMAARILHYNAIARSDSGELIQTPHGGRSV